LLVASYAAISLDEVLSSDVRVPRQICLDDVGIIGEAALGSLPLAFDWPFVALEGVPLLAQLDLDQAIFLLEKASLSVLLAASYISL